MKCCHEKTVSMSEHTPASVSALDAMIPSVLGQKFLSWRTVLEQELLSRNRVGLENLIESLLSATNNSLAFYEAAVFSPIPKRRKKKGKEREIIKLFKKH